jgi:hypothetical protein
MRYFWPLAAALAAIPSVAAAQVGPPLSSADCRLRIDTGSSTWVVRGFDLFNNTAPLGTYSVTFINEGAGECHFAPIFRLDSQPYGLSAGQTNRIPYGLVDLYADFVATPLSGRSERSLTRRFVSLNANEQQIVQFQFSVPLDYLKDDGEFVQDVILEAEQSDGSVLGGRPLVVGVDVMPSARLGLQGAFEMNGSQVSVNLGSLVEGVAPVPLQLSVQSTRRYRINVRSQNSGSLRLGDSDWTVPYQVLVGDHRFALSGGSSEQVYGSGNGFRRETMPLSFIIGSTTDRRAGTYSDVVSIEVSPQ